MRARALRPSGGGFAIACEITGLRIEMDQWKALDDGEFEREDAA